MSGVTCHQLNFTHANSHSHPPCHVQEFQIGGINVGEEEKNFVTKKIQIKLTYQGNFSFNDAN